MRTEVLAGITTFITVAYILILNPPMMAAKVFNGVFIGTCIGAWYWAWDIPITRP